MMSKLCLYRYNPSVFGYSAVNIYNFILAATNIKEKKFKKKSNCY